MHTTMARFGTRAVALAFALSCLMRATPASAVDTPLSVAIPSTQSFNVSSSPLGGTSGCDLVASTHYYDTKAIVVGVSGDYTFTATSATLSPGAPSDSFLALYSSTFDPASPATHLQGCNDDTNGLLPQMTLTGLTSGQVYVLLNTTFLSGVTGGVSLTVSGPGVVTVVSKPTVDTQAVTDVGATGAIGNGSITALGGLNAYERGFCWSTSANPDIFDSKTVQSGSFGAGAFTGTITGLTSGTTYHVRAYATNASGTSYGSDIVFTAGAASVPTLTEWGMIMMFALLVGAMLRVMHRQSQRGSAA